MCAIWKCVSVMSVGLAVLGLVNAITIDNHLITTKNDCYERLALGQRLDPRDVTRALPARTAQECQVACSEEDQRCLSLSFGISPQGNGTCELSYAPVRETADLQPIGTLRDPDFDLYIKKVDCKLNIPKDPPASDVQKPTYAVAVLDRPGPGAGHGYEVQEHSPRPPPRQHASRPPDVLVFYGDHPGGDYHSYQNYYDVPRPFPLPYSPDRDRDPLRPALDYPHDDRYYYGMPKPVPDINKYSPSYDYYGQRRPQPSRPYDRDTPNSSSYNQNNYDNRRPVDDRPYNSNVDRNRPHRPDVSNPDNPNIYDDRLLPEVQPYGPEPNRRNPYIPGYDNTRPLSYEPEYDRRPYKPNYPEPNYPVRRPTSDRPHEFEPDRKPLPFNRPYRPQNEENRPYGQNYDDNKPYVPNRPYGPTIEDNRLYSANRPYEPPLPENTYDRRPPVYDRNRPYGPVKDDFRPYLDPQYGKRQEKPYVSNGDNVKPDPDNPNYYDKNSEWDRLGTGYGSGKPMENQQQSPGRYEAKPQNPNKTSLQATSQGNTVTSIITQIVEPCYRRALAGKRIARSFIRRAVPCERVEDCQRECQNEKRFVCEGFNYRLDESGRGQGDCELTDLPLSRMDPGHDIIPDRDYDFYEKDRNSGPDCRPLPPPLRPLPVHGHGGSSWQPYPPPLPPPPHRRPALPPPTGPHYYGDRRKDETGPGYHGYYHTSSDRDHYGYGYNYSPGYDYPAPRPQYSPSLPPLPPRQPSLPPRPHLTGCERDCGHWGVPMYGYSGGYGHGGGHTGSYGHGGGPTGGPSGGPSYGWNRSQFVPYRVGQVGGPRDWGRYGGSYGGGYAQQDAYNYWGFDRHEHHDNRRIYNLPAPAPPPLPPPHTGPSGPGHYLPLPPHHREPLPPHHREPLPPHHLEPLPPHHLEPLPPHHLEPLPPHHHEPLPPLHHHEPPPYPPSSHGHGNQIGYDGYQHGQSYPRDDCSTRRGMGFRLHKGVVKKFYAVPNIHECEKLCYREKDFNCVSFSFRNVTDTYDLWTETDNTYEFDWTIEERIVNIPRYAITLSSPTDNCYLSDRPYNDLDFYTELEPDRDFDIYTMHRSQSCLVPVVEEESECFLRVRSGQRLDSSVVKDSMDAKTIVECQLECLTAARFTCRSFSYRWGPPHSGGAIDSCQLSDWPIAELDMRRDLVPEPGYEVYERGSYGHGCEQNHFEVPSHHGHLGPGQHIGDGSAVPKHSDKICYVGYAKPARLTAEAAKGALSVSSELDCKAECTRAREQSQFQCMSFSFRNVAARNQPNCELSDVEQRDLRPQLDYERDPDAWLFAWDSLSPQCTALLDQQHGSHGQDHVHNPLDTWRVYSVNGWPCRRGSTCQENREAGFWSCELEGGDVGSWDYCCRPDHHCGYSQGYNYPWCYVGPSRDQWRTCSDRYYPYLQYQQQQQQQAHQRHPGGDPYLPHSPAQHTPSSGHGTWYAERPYRPPYARPAPGPEHAHRPSLDEYEDKFHQQFLEPPRPGGLGRHWPVSYLHKETPPNATLSNTSSTSAPDERQHRKMDNAISNVVQAIQAADLNNTRYHAANQSDGADDILFVRLPMPTTSARLTESEARTPKFDVVDTQPRNKSKSSDGFDELFLISPEPAPSRNVTTPKRESAMFPGNAPVVRRGTITRTNRTARRRRLRPKNDLIQFLN